MTLEHKKRLHLLAVVAAAETPRGTKIPKRRLMSKNSSGARTRGLSLCLPISLSAANLSFPSLSICQRPLPSSNYLVRISFIVSVSLCLCCTWRLKRCSLPKRRLRSSGVCGICRSPTLKPNPNKTQKQTCILWGVHTLRQQQV